jgi:predicted peroxiredoxin
MIVVMPRKLLIVIVNTDPRNHEELGSPFFQAAVAAAMDFTVEVICTAAAGRLMKCGVAETLTVKPGSDKSVYDFIKDAHGLGAQFYACAGNLELFDMDAKDLIPECAGVVGTAYLIDRVMSDEYRVLSY